MTITAITYGKIYGTLSIKNNDPINITKLKGIAPTFAIIALLINSFPNGCFTSSLR